SEPTTTTVLTSTAEPTTTTVLTSTAEPTTTTVLTSTTEQSTTSERSTTTQTATTSLPTTSTAQSTTLVTTTSPTITSQLTTTAPPTETTTQLTSTAEPTTTTKAQSPTTPDTTQTVFVSFSSSDNFVSDLSNPASEAYKNREKKVKDTLTPLFTKELPSFKGLAVIRFRPGSIITDVNVTFGTLPSDAKIENTIMEANATLNITSVTLTKPFTTTTSSTTTTTTPTTTAAATATTTTTSTANPNTTTTTTSTANPNTTATTTTTKAPARPQPTVEIQIVIIVVFVPALSNPQTPEFKSLATKVETMFDEIYKKKFGPRFIRTIVIAFIAFFRTREESNVQAEVKLVFSEESTEPIPSNTDIVETLKEAAANSTAGFNLTIDATSITVIKSVQIIPLTILTNGNFVAALSNKSSTEFQNRASLIKTGLEPFFLADYPTSFSTISVTDFSDAGVKLRSVPKIRNSMDVVFGADAVLPNSTQIVNTVVRAARNNTLPFQIFTSSIIINGTEFSSGEVSSRISMLTASFLVAVSLLVPWFI
ncbi:integumentary mucin C.1-like, partial [Sinocyclocheilus grahami]|uniref:integumentary mucin C.1-like n=1 Tax=Sinocyclocheilus grahami TaxID=75366 RepID=UPI0007AD346A